MRTGIDPLYELVRQRGIVDQIARMRNELEMNQRRLPDAALGVERCMEDVTAAEQNLARIQRLAANATHRHAEMQTAIQYLTNEIDRLAAVEAEEAKQDVRRVAEAELARAQQEVEAATARLSETG